MKDISPCCHFCSKQTFDFVCFLKREENLRMGMSQRTVRTQMMNSCEKQDRFEHREVSSLE